MEPLYVDVIRQTLSTRLVGKDVHYLPEVDSTNAALLRLVNEDKATEGTVVLADTQTAGRGRLGKTWFSPPGVNLYLSVLLQPAIRIDEVQTITLIGSLALADAIEAEGVVAQVKWPNDVLVNDKKIAGVLSEIELGQGQVKHLILGIGANLNVDRKTMDQLFGEVAPGATSLCEAVGHSVGRDIFAVHLLEALDKRYGAFVSGGKEAMLDEWRRRSFLGRWVKVQEEDMHVEGVAMDIDDSGYLVVTLDDGSTVRVREGEVTPWDKTVNN